MGKVLIVSEQGEGLYQGKALRDLTGLRAEQARLELEEADYWRKMNKALDVMVALRSERHAARDTLDALVEQWKQALDEKLKPASPITPKTANPDGTNPATGQPYTEEERADALESEIAEQINEERAGRGLAPLGWDAGLAQHSRQRVQGWAAEEPFEALLRVQSLDDAGRLAPDRALESAPAAVIRQAADAIAAGQTSTRSIVDSWKRDPDTWAGLMHPNATHIGVGHQQNAALPGGGGASALTAEYASTPAQNPAFFSSSAGQALVHEVTQTLGADAANALKGGGGGGGSDGGQWSEAWQANHEYGVGATVMGTRRNNGGKLLAKNIGGLGVSGSQQPLWPGAGGVITDGELTWMVLSDIREQTAADIQTFYGW